MTEINEEVGLFWGWRFTVAGMKKQIQTIIWTIISIVVPGSAPGPSRSNYPIAEVFPFPHRRYGIFFLPTSDFSTANINFSGRDLKLTICNSPCYATEDLCHQCDLYYYNYYYILCTLQKNMQHNLRIS